MTTVYLHIGLPKTGTKSIQRSLHRARRRLKRNGVIYPDLAGPRSRGRIYHSRWMLLAFSDFEDLPPRSRVSRQEQNEFKYQVRQKLSAALADRRYEKMVLSGEGMTNLVHDGARRLRDFLSQWAEDVFVIVYLREPVAVASSLTQLLVQGGASIPSSPDEAPIPEFRFSVEPFLEAFGRQRLVFRPFPPERADDRGIVGDFLETIGCSDLEEWIPDIQSNVSWSDWAVRALDRYNRRHPKWIGENRDQKNPDRVIKPGVPFWLLSMKGPPFRFERSFLNEVAALQRDDQLWMEEIAGFKLPRETDVRAPEPERLESEAYDEMAVRLHELVLAHARGERKAERDAARAIIDLAPRDCEIGERLLRSAEQA